MLVFAKDIQERDHVHALEERDSAIRTYMEYQRNLFPYTFIRAGLDLAYKELDDILCYVDNDHQPVGDSNRQDYPADIPGWFKSRFPWTGAFMDMEDMHGLLVRLIKSMDSFRTHEVPNTWHLAVLYDTTHNITQVYNDVLETNPSGARDIHLSAGIPVQFEDFINNYWPHLEFMLLSKADYPHTKLIEKNILIEDKLKSHMADGMHPLKALETISTQFGFQHGTLELMQRDRITPELAEFQTRSIKEDIYSELYTRPDLPHLSKIDLDYSKNQANFKV